MVNSNGWRETPWTYKAIQQKTEGKYIVDTKASEVSENFMLATFHAVALADCGGFAQEMSARVGGLRDGWWQAEFKRIDAESVVEKHF